MNLIKKNNFYNSNDFFIIKKKLKFLIEVILETDGSFSVSSKLALLLTQSGIYENKPIYEFLEEYFSYIEMDEDIENEGDLDAAKLYDVGDEESYDELDNELESSMTFLVSFIFIFSKKNRKTKIFILNPFSNFFLNAVMKRNFIDCYFNSNFNLDYYINNKFFKKKIFLNNYFDYFYKMRKKIFSINKKRFYFNYLKRKKFFFKYLLWRKKIKNKKFRRKGIFKKFKMKKFNKFMFMFKSQKWFNYIFFFKIILLSSYYFSGSYLYLKLKLNLYSYISFFGLYRRMMKRKFKKRKPKFKKKFGRNRYGELMSIIRSEINTKKKINVS